MEKNRIPGLRFRCHRLLIACVVISIFLPSLCFGIVPFQTLLRSLKIIPEQSFCFVGDTCNFVLTIPEYLPSRIDVTVQSTPDGVALMSLTKDGYEEDGVKGTRIFLTFKFTKKGTYKIPSMATLVDWRYYQVPFQSITVYEDPRTLLPEISVSVPKSVYAQEAFSAKVSMRFFSEIIEVYSDLEENVIIKPSDDSVALPFERKEFTEEYAFIAAYDLTPIDSGTLTIPAFHVLAKTYAGGQVLLTSEAQTVKVLAAKQKTAGEESQGYYASVLGTPEEEEYEPEKKVVVTDSWEHNIPKEIATIITQKRKIRKIFFYVFLALLVASLSFLILSVVKKRKKISRFAALAFVMFLAASVVFFILASSTKCVAAYDATIYSIPEEKSSSASSVYAGEIMTVKSVRSDWYSVKLSNGSEGWIKSIDCIYCGN
ncbi:MAG: hypothetical protein K5930_00835 [Treponemataceae bacterium]|nr:hypothetical protein [Treponemataceae bacterium]